MKIDDVKPAHCYARAKRLLGETALIREELGRAEDSRPSVEIAGAQPRECYFEAMVAWRKAERLALEIDVRATPTVPPTPGMREVRPGHVLQVLDGVLTCVEDIKRVLGITESVSEPAIEPDRQPSDVLMTIIRINRELSRCLERPFTPSDVYQTVALASVYAARIGANAELAPFERKRKPQNCYEVLESCLAAAAAQIGKRGEQALRSRGTPTDVVPGDVYDLANLVLGEVAFLHSLTPNAVPVHPFELASTAHRLPSHVYQLARTLEKQLTSMK